MCAAGGPPPRPHGRRARAARDGVRIGGHGGRRGVADRGRRPAPARRGDRGPVAGAGQPAWTGCGRSGSAAPTSR
ncbi:MAG: hypothetical protein MZW92_02140 [Comamonadaceae bacterium]|nr:hypothetical protein [Comamonadaceae bacterium]